MGSTPTPVMLPLSVEGLLRERSGMVTIGLQELKCPIANPGAPRGAGELLQGVPLSMTRTNLLEGAYARHV